MSRIALGCIADDYTGASDLANTLTRAGLRTLQTIGVPADSLALDDADAVVVSLKSRSIAPTEAVAQSRAACAWLKGRGARHVMFKICSTFDSTDAGNIGPVTDALREDASAGPALVTPAFPINGRTVYQGRLFVGSVPLDESPLKDHPLNPMRDADLVRVLGRQSAAPVGLIPLGLVAAGPEAVRARLTELASQGAGAAIVDAVFDADVEVIGEVALDGALSVGASGLGLGLARALIARGWVGRAAASARADGPVGGMAACIAGSCSAATLAQVARAEAAGMPTLRLDAMALAASDEEAQRALAWAAPRLSEGPVLIASSAPPEVVSAVQARLGGVAASHAIEGALATVAEGLVRLGVRRLVVAGGETSGAVVDRLRLPAFAVGEEIAPGVPVLRSAGHGRPDMLLALKSGNFGGAEFFADALRLMA